MRKPSSGRPNHSPSSDGGKIVPLKSIFTAEGRETLRSIVEWLGSLSEENALRFTEKMDEVLPELCRSVARDIADQRPFHPDEAASLAYSRPAYLHLFTTQKKRARRSSSGVYRLYYDLTDADNDGQADTLRVLSIRHAAARPVWNEDESQEGSGA